MSENDSMINSTVRSKIKTTIVRGKPLQSEDPFQYRWNKFNNFIQKEIEKNEIFQNFGVSDKNRILTNQKANSQKRVKNLSESKSQSQIEFETFSLDPNPTDWWNQNRIIAAGLIFAWCQISLVLFRIQLTIQPKAKICWSCKNIILVYYEFQMKIAAFEICIVIESL